NSRRQFPKISVRPALVRIWKVLKVTKWSIFQGELTMSEQSADQTGGDSGPLIVEPGIAAPSDAEKAPEAAGQALACEFSVADTDKGVGAVEATAVPATDATAKAPVTPAIGADAEPAKVEAAKSGPADILGKVIVMTPRDRGFADHGATSKPETAAA